jgi:hypothetical protein
VKPCASRAGFLFLSPLTAILPLLGKVRIIVCPSGFLLPADSRLA